MNQAVFEECGGTAGRGIRPFRLENTLEPALGRPLSGMGAKLLANLLRLDALNSIYASATLPERAGHFCDRGLAAMNVALRVPQQDLERIPANGPVIIVSNHPFGLLDGLLLGAIIARRRPEFRLLANRMLAAMPELAPLLFCVDVFAGEKGARENRASMRSALQWLDNGGAIGMFPAGEVSHLHARTGAWRVQDGKWNDTVVRLAMRSGAAIVPLHIDGRNSLSFQLLGLLHPLIRTAMLPTEMLKQRHTTVQVRVGRSIAAERLEQFTHAGDAVAYLRARSYLLRPRSTTTPKPKSVVPATHRPVAEPDSIEALAAEVESIRADNTLARSGEFEALCGTAGEIPRVLQEIGRLREITFRGVGEGTGQSRDLDRFDEHYVHLFVWHRSRREVVGAYRLGCTDVILPKYGVDGLYTSTLFHYQPKLLPELTPGIELGRSFVRPEYQKEYAPLLLLWKSIGAFCVREPRYRYLFGPVSISDSYQPMSQQLMIAFLKTYRILSDLHGLVAPRRKPRLLVQPDVEAELVGSAAPDVDELEDLVADLESSRLGVPVLIRQYLKLGARVLGFNVDSAFSNVLDALMLVDLAKLDRRVLGRYMGLEAAGKYLQYHRTLHADAVPEAN